MISDDDVHVEFYRRPAHFLLNVLKELSHAVWAKYKNNQKTTSFGVNLYCFRYDFSVALISALAILKCVNLRLAVVV